jgi:putative endonuclease
VSYSVYVIRSERNGRYYIGFSGRPEARLEEHNAGTVKATRYLRPWTLVYSEQFTDASAARRREHHLKSMKSRKYLEALIRGSGELVRAPR